MAAVCPTGFDTERLRAQVLATYDRVAREIRMEARANPDFWAACIGGALPEPELFEVAAAAGLHDGRITERFDCFRGTSAAAKVSKDLRVHAVNFYARKP